MTTTRSAQVHWQGGLAQGSGEITTSSSGTLLNMPVSWPARTAEGAEGAKSVTSPEELIAAAHASCFSMALAATLEKAGLAPQEMDVEAMVTFAKTKDGQFTITRSALTVVASVPGIDEAAFASFAQDAKMGCPVSRALEGNVAVEVSASLSSEQLAAAAGP
jgi:osmotically inducible protein OsmC